MDLKSNTDKFCIIGAGSSGLAAAKTFSERGIPFDCLERERDIGGLWNEATNTGVVYDTTYLVSSRRYTGFEDYPFPEEYPTYPSHRETLSYLRAYAMNFGILDRIELNATVEHAERVKEGWRVEVAGEARPRFYRALAIANGHHHVPRMPKIPGTFTGEVIHSRDYRSVKQLADKRVVVVGSGNSGCDIVVDATSVARKVYLSTRRGTYFVPKFMFGRPMDGIINFCEKFPMPRGLRNRLYTHWHRLMVGKNERYGLPEPEHRIMDTHPTMTTVLPQLFGHGRIGVKPDITEFAGTKCASAKGAKSRPTSSCSPPATRLQFRSSTTVSCSGLTSGRCSISTSFIPSLMTSSLSASSRPTAPSGGLPTTNRSLWRVTSSPWPSGTSVQTGLRRSSARAMRAWSKALT